MVILKLVHTRDDVLVVQTLQREFVEALFYIKLLRQIILGSDVSTRQLKDIEGWFVKRPQLFALLDFFYDFQIKDALFSQSKTLQRILSGPSVENIFSRDAVTKQKISKSAIECWRCGLQNSLAVGAKDTPWKTIFDRACICGNIL
jgi:hypothetical protein